MSETRIVGRSPVVPAPPVVVSAGWECSARRSTASLRLCDCTPMAKVGVRAPVDGATAGRLGMPFGRATRQGGTLLVGSGPGEWLALGAPGTAAALLRDLEGRAEPGEFVTCVDLTHGRALLRLTGPASAATLAKVCGIDLDDDFTPDGAAFRSSVARLATDVVRDDVPRGGGRERSYLLHCERSSGQYLFDALLDAGDEFGIDIEGFAAGEDRSQPPLPKDPDDDIPT